MRNTVRNTVNSVVLKAEFHFRLVEQQPIWYCIHYLDNDIFQPFYFKLVWLIKMVKNITLSR